MQDAGIEVGIYTILQRDQFKFTIKEVEVMGCECCFDVRRLDEAQCQLNACGKSFDGLCGGAYIWILSWEKLRLYKGRN